MPWCYQMLHSVIVQEWFTKVITQTPLSLINTVAYAREKIYAAISGHRHEKRKV